MNKKRCRECVHFPDKHSARTEKWVKCAVCKANGKSLFKPLDHNADTVKMVEVEPQSEEDCLTCIAYGIPSECADCCRRYGDRYIRKKPEPEVVLLPCPFCGGLAQIYTIPPYTHIFAKMPDYDGGCFIECCGCPCAISGDTEEETIAAWNNRAVQDND